MIPAIVALLALNALTVYVQGRREARIIDALMARNAGEYGSLRRAENKPAKTPKPPIDEDAPNIYPMIGL